MYVCFLTTSSTKVQRFLFKFAAIFAVSLTVSEIFNIYCFAKIIYR